MAAVLAGGEGAVLSHLSAAHLWRLLEPRRGPIHVSVPSTAGRARRRGIVIHRYPALQSTTFTEELGIPVTKPAKTLGDLKGVIFPAQHRRAIRQAEVRGMQHRPGDDSRADPERAGAPLPVPLPPAPPAEAGGQRTGRALRGRLPLGAQLPDRRNRRLPLPPRPPGLRGRPRPRSRPPRPRLRLRHFTYRQVTEQPAPEVASSISPDPGAAHHADVSDAENRRATPI